MAASFIREKQPGRLRLLCCLVLAALMLTQWIGAGHSEAGVQALNSSGNLNRKPSVDPNRRSQGYSAVLYDNRNGLPTSEANAIAQTSEGFLWIGSYAGLIRYDGTTFERLDSTTGIANVRCLYVDSQDRLWIGTNDSGLFMMAKGELRNWNRKTGLPSVSVRAVAQDGKGVFYIAGTAGIAMLDGEMNLTVLRDERIADQIIWDIRAGVDGLIYGLTQNGDIFTMRDGKIATFLSQDACRIKGVLSVFPDPKHPGTVYLGTNTSQVYYGNLENNFASLGVKDITPLTAVERFEYINGQIWICAGNGIGNLDSEGFHALLNVPMNNSVCHVMTDYEGNLWFTSIRQGVMKIVPNQFTDLFARYDYPVTTVNATCMYERLLFVATDSGLTVMDDGKRVSSVPVTRAATASGKSLDVTNLVDFLDGVRIRSINRDSGGRLWISTWRRHGLLRYDHGELMAFTPDDGLFSDQVRTVSECEDGTILAAGTGGVNTIQGDRVTGGFGAADGLSVNEILTLTEGFHHEMILGSDGDGIYIVGPDGTKRIGAEDGLSSEVILRIKRSRDQQIYWIVTGNSLAYMTPDYQVTTVRLFPYPNNFDLYQNSKGDIWVLSSSGIYVVPERELLANGPVEPIHYGISSGLPCTATANSFSELTAEGDLYIAGSLGVVRVNIEKPFENISDLKVGVPFLDADGTRYYPDGEGGFTLPGNVRKLTVYPYVFNYSPTDPQVSFRLEGFDAAYTTVSHRDLDPVVYTNLPVGVYQFAMNVKDPAGQTDKTVSFRIVKGKEATVGTAGSVIVDAASLFFMTGILIYTSLYRKRGRLDDRLFFAMILTNMALAVADAVSYLLEGSAFGFVREVMTAGNTIFYAAFVVFPYLYLLYLDFRAYQDKTRMRRLKLLDGIPCLLLLILLAVNLKTGWVFTIGTDNLYYSGPLNNLVFLPVIFYFVLSLLRVYRINHLLVPLGILLIAARLAWGVWFRDISSTAFTYTLFLMCTHIHVLNLPMNEEAT